MSLADIRTAVVAAIEAVPNVGVVSDYEPYCQREEEFRTFFKSPTLGYVLGWTVSRTDTGEAWAGDRDNRVAHTIMVRGYRSLAEHGATEREFQDLIEAVRDEMRKGQRTLFGGVCRWVGPPNVRTVEARQFSDCLVHYTEIAQECADLLQIARP